MHQYIGVVVYDVEAKCTRTIVDVQVGDKSLAPKADQRKTSDYTGIVLSVTKGKNVELSKDAAIAYIPTEGEEKCYAMAPEDFDFDNLTIPFEGENSWPLEKASTVPKRRKVESYYNDTVSTATVLSFLGSKLLSNWPFQYVLHEMKAKSNSQSAGEIIASALSSYTGKVILFAAKEDLDFQYDNTLNTNDVTSMGKFVNGLLTYIGNAEN